LEKTKVVRSAFLDFPLLQIEADERLQQQQLQQQQQQQQQQLHSEALFLYFFLHNFFIQTSVTVNLVCTCKHLQKIFPNISA